MKKPRKYHISFDIIDELPQDNSGFGYVAAYCRKESLEKIREVFGDYCVENIKCRRVYN